MSESVALSVVIPTLNEEAGIATAVARAWGLEPVDVIVADGGSGDATIERATGAAAVVVEAPCGRGSQLNAGAARAEGDVLLFLHADCWLDPDAGSQIIQSLADGSVAWGAFRQAIDGRGVAYRWLESGNAFRARRLRLPYGDQAVFVRRAVFESVGGFADVPLMEDVDFARRMRRHPAPALLPGPVHASARRWKRNGVVCQTVCNWAFLAMWRMGVPPERLAKWYRPHSGVPTPANNVSRAGAARPGGAPVAG